MIKAIRTLYSDAGIETEQRRLSLGEALVELMFEDVMAGATVEVVGPCIKVRLKNAVANRDVVYMSDAEPEDRQDLELGIMSVAVYAYQANMESYADVGTDPDASQKEVAARVALVRAHTPKREFPYDWYGSLSRETFIEEYLARLADA